MTIIAFTGPAGCGKSTAATYLSERYGARRIRFADPLKAMTRALLTSAGYDVSAVDRMVEGDLKERPLSVLGGKTTRHAMQTLGSEWGRDLMDNSLWADLWARRAKDAVAVGVDVVVEDLRFSNEAHKVKEADGIIVSIQGRGKFAGFHVSETGDAASYSDYRLFNNRDVSHLKADIDALWRSINSISDSSEPLAAVVA